MVSRGVSQSFYVSLSRFVMLLVVVIVLEILLFIHYCPNVSLAIYKARERELRLKSLT